MARKERRQNQQFQEQRSGLYIKDVKPITMNQASAFREFSHGNHLVLFGCAGTGKSFVGLGLALKAVQAGHFKQVVIYRSTVPTRDMGFLPGSAADKTAVYEAPYQGICSELYGRDDAWSILKMKKAVEFKPTAFIRGITEAHSVIIVDEVQNMSYHEISSIITRMGDNTRLILCGDYYQSDLIDEDREGIWKAIKRLQRMDDVTSIEFTPKDIVRSGFVKKWIELEYAERFPEETSDKRRLERVA